MACIFCWVLNDLIVYIASYLFTQYYICIMFLTFTFMNSDDYLLSETESSVAEFPAICRDRMILLRFTFMSSDESDLSENQSSVSVFT
jgi:hypothetical protein